eukprot:CAMPEP_0119482780 /NCGR_PEP_ID=MMETSP1344-20130328/10484_1 /TAXON_ID=236787 /ORGANISM="Florenciella parvula, Strain CCMP2471" /LENGTH=396 /DNA_ID=CAMNT_0007517219 /DNA_START=144 /DNA_END=1334 /DNA_ORIENTATION=-
MDSLLGLGSSDEDEPSATLQHAAADSGLGAAFDGESSSSMAGAAATERDDLGLGSDSDSEGGGAEAAAAAAAANSMTTTAVAGAANEAGPASNDYTFTIPNLPRPRRSSSVHMTRLPNVLGFREKEFTPEAFAESEDGQRFHRNLALWRYKRDEFGEVMRDADKHPIRESNSRLVKWSDGSMQLFVGNEPYEVAVRPADQSFLFVKQAPKESMTLLECQGEIASRVQFQPASLASDTHKKLTTKVRLENMKTSRIREVATVNDPERLKAEREREAMKRQRAQQSKGRGRSKSSSRPGMKSTYLEDDTRYDVVADVGDIKSKARASEYDDSEDSFEASGSDEDGDDFGSQSRPASAKEDSDDEGAVDGEDEEDSDDDATIQRARKKQRAHDLDSESE